MKYLNYFGIFEDVNSYDYEKKGIEYTFKDIVGNEYKVSFIKKEESYELLYFVYDDDSYNVSKIVNVNPYKTIKTVFGDILKDFIKNINPVSIIIKGLSKEQEKEYISQRTKVYLRFLNNNKIDGYSIVSYGNIIKLTKKI